MCLHFSVFSGLSLQESLEGPALRRQHPSLRRGNGDRAHHDVFLRGARGVRRGAGDGGVSAAAAVGGELWLWGFPSLDGLPSGHTKKLWKIIIFKFGKSTN